MTNTRQNLERKMREKGINATDLARISGVPQSTIYRFLTGQHGDPRSETIKKLADALGITEAELRGIYTVNYPQPANEPRNSKKIEIVLQAAKDAMDSLDYEFTEDQEWELYQLAIEVSKQQPITKDQLAIIIKKMYPRS